MSPSDPQLASVPLGEQRLAELGIEMSAASRDYVGQRREYQLHTLLTEQRHPQTERLSRQIAEDTTAGLGSLFAVDEDIARALADAAADAGCITRLREAALLIYTTLREDHRVYVYGTGSTGRLAATLESALWRPFWERLLASPVGAKIELALPGITDRVRGEITGGDRALISSLEGFEDLQLIGRLQLEDNGITGADAVFAVTEGGETSAVIGTALAAAEQPASRADRVWFLFNNPPALLRPFHRCRQVLDHPRVRALPLPTGPQAIAGSTRMQATTTSLYVLGVLLEWAAHRLLEDVLSEAERFALGVERLPDIGARLRGFAQLQSVTAASAQTLAAWTDAEAQTYAQGRRAVYLARQALMPVFVDVTERAPTFRLAPLDTVDAASPASWIDVSAPVVGAEAAWQALLHRPFHGLDPARYRGPFEQAIGDAFLRKAALRGLAMAGQDQRLRYDLSLAIDVGTHGLAVLVVIGDETLSSVQRDWLARCKAAGARTVVVSVGDAALASEVDSVFGAVSDVAMIRVHLPIESEDLFGLDRAIALKMLLNAHSSAVMAMLGRVAGNTMTAVQPGNLKLIGRATHLIQSHLNAVVASARWRAAHGQMQPFAYAEANALLFAAMAYRKHAQDDAAAEVELAITAAVHALADGNAVDWSAAAAALRTRRLDALLAAWLD